jgi:hypothetical protein
MLTRCIKYSTTSILDAVKGFLTLSPHQSTHFLQHRIYCLVVSFLHDEMMNAESSIETPLSIRDCLITALQQNLFSWLADVVVLSMFSWLADVVVLSMLNVCVVVI